MVVDAVEACFVVATLRQVLQRGGEESIEPLSTGRIADASPSLAFRNDFDGASQTADSRNALGRGRTPVKDTVTHTVHGSRPNPDNDAIVDE